MESFKDMLTKQNEIEQLEARREALAKARQQQLGTLAANKEAQALQANNALNNNLQQEFINKQMTLKTLPQIMSARGYGGGLAETTEASILNNYQNGRNALMRDNTAQMADLDRSYNADYNSAALDYGNQIAGYDLDLAQLKNNLEVERTAIMSLLIAQGYSDDQINYYLNYGVLPHKKPTEPDYVRNSLRVTSPEGLERALLKETY